MSENAAVLFPTLVQMQDQFNPKKQLIIKSTQTQE